MRKLKVDPALEKLVPALTKAQYNVLKEDIRARGKCLDPIHITKDGTVLDGHNRWRIIQELKDEGVKITYQVHEHTFGRDRDTAIPSMVRAINLHRRQMTREQQHALILEELKANPTDSNRKLAKLLGVDHHLIAKIRAKGEATGEVAPVEKTMGADNKNRKRRPLPRRAKTRTVPQRVPEPTKVEEPAKVEAPADSSEDDAADGPPIEREPQELPIEPATGNGHNDANGADTQVERYADMVDATWVFMVAVHEYAIDNMQPLDMDHIVSAARDWLDNALESVNRDPQEFNACLHRKPVAPAATRLN
jgi:hypothetical protein